MIKILLFILLVSSITTLKLAGLSHSQQQITNTTDNQQLNNSTQSDSNTDPLFNITSTPQKNQSTTQSTTSDPPKQTQTQQNSDSQSLFNKLKSQPNIIIIQKQCSKCKINQHMIYNPMSTSTYCKCQTPYIIQKNSQNNDKCVLSPSFYGKKAPLRTSNIPLSCKTQKIRKAKAAAGINQIFQAKGLLSRSIEAQEMEQQKQYQRAQKHNFFTPTQGTIYDFGSILNLITFLLFVLGLAHLTYNKGSFPYILCSCGQLGWKEVVVESISIIAMGVCHAPLQGLKHHFKIINLRSVTEGNDTISNNLLLLIGMNFVMLFLTVISLRMSCNNKNEQQNKIKQQQGKMSKIEKVSKIKQIREKKQRAHLCDDCSEVQKSVKHKSAQDVSPEQKKEQKEQPFDLDVYLKYLRLGILSVSFVAFIILAINISINVPTQTNQ